MSSQLIILFDAIKLGDIASVRKIIFANPELMDHVREDDYFKDTPLTFSAKHNQKEIVELLLKRGADINKTNAYGFNPYFSAVDEYHYDLAISLLNEKSLDLNHKSYSKADALGQVLRTVQHLYTEQMFDPKMNINLLFKLIDALLEKGFDINKPQLSVNIPPVVISASCQSWTLVAYLISKGADYTAKGNMDHDIWTYFCGNQYFTVHGKTELFNLLELTIKQSGEKYGKIVKPENFYVDMFGEPFEPATQVLI
jgi:hypothetical protein